MSTESVAELEMLINEFFRYQCLRKGYNKSNAAFAEYESVTARLEPLRQSFALPARFEENKFIRKDNSESINGIVVEIKPNVDDQVEMVGATADAEPGAIRALWFLITPGRSLYGRLQNRCRYSPFRYHSIYNAFMTLPF